MSSMFILQTQIDSATLMTWPKRTCLFFRVSNFESLIPFSIISEIDFLLTQIPATIIGPNNDPLPASSTPQMIFSLLLNSNPFTPNQHLLLFYPYPFWNHDILRVINYPIN